VRTSTPKTFLGTLREGRTAVVFESQPPFYSFTQINTMQNNLHLAIEELTRKIANAIMRGDRYYSLYEYDEELDKVVEYIRADLPSPQRAGTMYQQVTYATLKARPIASTLLQS